MIKAGAGAGGAKEWFSAADVVAAKSPELPSTVDGFNRMAVANGWRADPARARPVKGRGRSNWEYHISALPSGAQTRLILMQETSPNGSSEAPLSPLWDRFEALPAKQKAEAQRRLEALLAVETLIRAGQSESAAIARTSHSSQISQRSLYRYRSAVAGMPRADWLPALAPAYKATAAFSDCHPKAWNVLCSDWLRAERPAFSACYRRMRKEASANGWLPIPTERSLRRRIEAEVPRAVVTLAREGRDKAKTLYPAQRRIRSHLHAMQAVNMDGHRLDVFVRTADGRITRLHLLALQDLYSGLFVAWRLSETENKETVRLVIGDMVERYGIPDRITIDNGRAFSSKWISGGTPNRYRFKVRDEDPRGLLTTLGVEIVFTQPYSGQSKPIERAFRDLTETIARDPLCAGAYTGNRPENKPENYGTKAVDEAVFRAHVDAQIHEHNARSGRRSAVAAGRSFLETFNASMAEASTIVRRATAAQRALWLLAAERIRAKKGSGEIELFGNRYWARELNEVAGTYVTVRFDPERLHEPVQVYSADDRLICRADCIADVGFDSAEAARATSRDRGAYLKALREHERLREKLSADELARIYASDRAAQEPAPPLSKVTRLAVANGAPVSVPVPEFDFDEAFSRGVRLLISND